MALFGDEGSFRREPRSLVEFRAGKMKVTGSTVTADARKGLIYLKMDDNLVHFCWKDRTSDQLEDDFIIFPGDAEIKSIAQCKTGRVVLLKFKDTNRKCFYWLQEPKEEKDDEYLKKVNDIITNPPVGGMNEGGHQRLPGGAAQLQSLLQNGEISQQQIMELLTSGALGGPGGVGALESLLTGGGGGGSGLNSGRGSESRSDQESQRSVTTPSTRPQSTRRTEPSPRLQLSDLQSALASIQSQPNSNTDGSEQVEQRDVTLQDIITSENLRPLSHEEEFQQVIGPHLPNTNEDVETGITSPQFQQAVGTFSSALSSGQLGPLMTEFGLNTDVANSAATGSTTRFIQAMEAELSDKETQDKKETTKETNNDQ